MSEFHFDWNSAEGIAIREKIAGETKEINDRFKHDMVRAGKVSEFARALHAPVLSLFVGEGKRLSAEEVDLHQVVTVSWLLANLGYERHCAEVVGLEQSAKWEREAVARRHDPTLRSPEVEEYDPFHEDPS